MTNKITYGRPRAFDEKEALTTIHYFWEHGYDNISLLTTNGTKPTIKLNDCKVRLLSAHKPLPTMLLHSLHIYCLKNFET